MVTTAPRFLLAVSSLVLALGSVAHAAAFSRAATALSMPGLPPFIAGSSKALWLSDSSTLLIVAVAFALIALRPAAASGAVVMVIALIPAATAVLIYRFLGPFYAGHMLLAAAAAAFLAGLLLGSRA
jgi:hypothetical protein